ncbi:hypothetical protein CYMTET_50819, partial [Cymbomonas tetramitiformis]
VMRECPCEKGNQGAKGTREVRSEGLDLRGECSGLKAAAQDFGIENKSVVQYWATKWSKNEDIVAALRLCAELAANELTTATPLTEYPVSGGSSQPVTLSTGNTPPSAPQIPNTDSPAPVLNLLETFASTCVGVASGQVNLDANHVAHSSDGSGYCIPELVDLEVELDEDSVDEVTPPHFSPNKTSDFLYKELYKWAAQAVKDELLSTRHAQNLIFEKYGVHIDHTTRSFALPKGLLSPQ